MTKIFLLSAICVHVNLLWTALCCQTGKFAGSPLEGQECQPQGLGYTEDAAEHEQMTAVLRTSLQGGDSPSSVLPGLRTRTRATRGTFTNLYSEIQIKVIFANLNRLKKKLFQFIG